MGDSALTSSESNAPITLPRLLYTLRRFRFPHKIGVLDRLFGVSLAKQGVCWVQMCDGHAWKLDLRSAAQRRAVYDEYLGQAAAWSRQWLASGGTVIDSGANIGQTVVVFASCDNVTVLAVEPNPASADWIDECLQAYPNWDVHVLRQGLGERTSTLRLTLPNFVGEQSAQATFRSDWYVDRNNDYVEVPVGTIDDLLESRQLDRIRLWKLDVEGWELQVLKGAERSLQSGSVDAILMELHPSNQDAARSYLANHGYELHEFSAAGTLVKAPMTLPKILADYVVLRS